MTGTGRPDPGLDLATVEALCRLVVLARRLGCSVVIDAPDDVRELLGLTGVGDAVLGDGEAP